MSSSPVPAADVAVTPPAPLDHDEDMLDLFLKRKALRSPATAAKYRRELARFRAAVPQPLHAVTFGDLQRYVESRTGLRAPASQALAVAILRSFFRFCLRLGYLPLNPADLLEPPRVPCTSDLRWCLLDELAAILAAADRLNPTAGLLCAVLALTGLRIAEAAGIRWSAFLRDPHGNVGLRVIGKGGKGVSDHEG